MTGSSTPLDGESKLFGHIQRVLTYHEMMLSDGIRNAAFSRALRQNVTPGCSVLDIGTGTGIWAIAAAKLGAKRVVAVEREHVLIPIIERLIRRNAVEQIVQVVHGDSRELQLQPRFDLVVSETVGNEAFDEQIVPIMIDARRRFLKKGGKIIPHAVASVIAPAHFHRERRLPAGVSLDFQFLQSIAADIPKKVRHRTEIELLGRPRVLAEVDLRRVRVQPELRNLTATWKLREASKVNCLILWADVVLTEGVRLKTIDSPNWSPIRFPVDPLGTGPLKLECSFTFADNQYYWTLTAIRKGERKIQSHSPVFPYTTLKARMSP